MKRHKTHNGAILLLFVIAILTASCGGQQAVAPEPPTETTVIATLTTAPTEEPIPTPTEEPISTPTTVATNNQNPSFVQFSNEDIQMILSFIPAGAGGDTPCDYFFREHYETTDQPLLYTTQQAGEQLLIGQSLDICLQNTEVGEVEIKDPTGTSIHTFAFNNNSLGFGENAFTALPGDIPGRYTVTAQTNNGELTTTFMVTDQIVEVTEPRITELSRNTGEGLQIFLNGFNASETVDMFLYQPCNRNSGANDYAFTGYGLSVQVGEDGRAFIPLSDATKAMQEILEKSPRNILAIASESLKEPLVPIPDGIHITFPEGYVDYDNYNIPPCPFQKVWLGINKSSSVTPEIARSKGLPEDQRGVLIGGVDPDSPAAQAELRSGDIIIRIYWVDADTIETFEDLQTSMQSRSPGDTITLTIIRDGAEQEVQVTLVVWPDS